MGFVGGVSHLFGVTASVLLNDAGVVTSVAFTSVTLNTVSLVAFKDGVVIDMVAFSVFFGAFVILSEKPSKSTNVTLVLAVSLFARDPLLGRVMLAGKGTMVVLIMEVIFEPLLVSSTVVFIGSAN